VRSPVRRILAATATRSALGAYLPELARRRSLIAARVG